MTERGVAAAAVERTLRKPLGFYWTEGRSGIGLTVDGILPLKVDPRLGFPLLRRFAVGRERPLRRRDRILGQEFAKNMARDKAYGRSLSCGTFHTVGVANLLVTFLDDRKPNERLIGPRRKSFDPS